MHNGKILPLVFTGLVSSGCMESNLHLMDDATSSETHGEYDDSGSHETTLPGLSIKELVEACLGIDATACPEPHQDNDDEDDLDKWAACITDADERNSAIKAAFEWEIGIPVEDLDEESLNMPLTLCGYTRFANAHYQNDDLEINVLDSELKILIDDQLDKVSSRNCAVEDEDLFVLSCEAYSFAPFSEGYDADFENLQVLDRVEGSDSEGLNTTIVDHYALSSGEYDAININRYQFSPEEGGFAFGNTYSELGSNISEIHRLSAVLNGEPWTDNEKSATRFLIGGEDQ